MIALCEHRGSVHGAFQCAVDVIVVLAKKQRKFWKNSSAGSLKLKATSYTVHANDSL